MPVPHPIAPKYPTAVVKIEKRVPKNAHEIVMRVRQQLIRAGATKQEINDFQTLAFRGSYEDLLALVHKWVTVEN